MDTPRSGKRCVLMFMLFSVAAGALSATGLAEVVGYDPDNPPVVIGSDEVVVAAETLAALQAELAAAKEREAQLLAAAGQKPLNFKEAHFLPDGPSILAHVDLVDFLAAAEADRRLLAELRKMVPENRQEAEIFLARLKKLAERADPVRLAPRANRVLEQAPIYYDWLETEFETAEEQIYEYYIGGAQGFSRALQEFQNAVLMTAINRLDTASRALQEAYAAPEE